MTAALQVPDRRQRELLGRLRLSLPRLDALLRAEGFVIGPDRWQNVYDLLLAMHERGRLPEKAGALRPLLAPLFCRNAEEQGRFAKVFRRWLDELAHEPDAVPERLVIREEPQPEPPPRPSWRPLILGLMLAVLALAAVSYGFARYFSGPDISEVETLKPPLRPPPAPDTSQVERPERSLELQPLPPRTPQEKPNLSAASQAWLRAAGWFVSLLPTVLLVDLLIARWLSWNMVLRRRPDREGVPLHAITLDAGQDDLFAAPALREALKRLHTPVPVLTHRLDTDATVRASANNAGLFHPVWRQRRLVPDCVVLLDHVHGSDQMAGLALQAVERLRQAGLEVVRYDYRRDPRRLMGADGRWHSLGQVAARHEGSRLLVVGEATSLVNPLIGDLYRWTDVIELWPMRGLLSTRRPPQAWRDVLAARQFLVADLSSAGLAETAAWFSPVSVEPIPIPTAFLRPLPVALQDDERWLQPATPPSAERDALLQTLRNYLGADGLLLLASMAAYPQLHWGLTRALDLGLYRDQTADQRERRLLAVARLPWCRAGGLPDWLREALKADLDADGVERIARLYQWLMNEAEVNGQGSISLPVSLPERGRFWRDLRRWLRSRGQVADRYDPHNDRVFVEMLLGRRARFLDFRLPHLLARRLGPRLNALLPRLVLAVVIAAAAGWTTHRIWNEWGREPVGNWLLTWQLQDHQRITVDIWHTEATQGYAQALAQVLREARFQVVVEPRELTMTPSPERQAEDAAGQTQIQPVNAVQWGAAGDQDAAAFVANRLGYLTWGGVPNQVAPGAELPLTGPGLDAPPEPSHVRVLLMTPARDRTGFAFRDPLTAVQGAVQYEPFRDALKDGGQGPEMVRLPGGSFLMGSPSDEPGRSSDEGPQHEVRIHPFAIGKTEVTFADYDAFAEATGRKKPDDRGWGRDQRPVINVSWNDAVAYAEWLREQTGQRYRLPTEAEWEYAARAGTETPFWTGDCIATDQANYNGNYDYNYCGADTGVYRRQTVEAGSLPANGWGLHETAGNVREWVQDCTHENYQGDPENGSAWEEPGCALRVVRGGGWYDVPEFVRSAFRGANFPDEAYDDLGFRLARDL